MTFLLDVNVLLALIDPRHVAFDLAHDWFAAEGHLSWATCPLVENGAVRIAGSSAYPSNLGQPALVADVLARFCRAPEHVFWPDELSLLTSPLIDRSTLVRSSAITDTYLLGLAAQNGGKLATLDRRLSTRVVKGGREALVILQDHASSSMSQ